MLGTIGELLIILAFVASGLSALAFFLAEQRNDLSWRRVGRSSWVAMAAALIATSGIFWYVILTHQYQYAYVYQQSSNDLPLRYLISTFWAGQEGSFLLWGLMMTLVGGLLIAFVRQGYESAVMAVVALSQTFLLSMIVGLQIGPLEIGASPYATLAERFTDAPIFQQNPDFIPADGQGLNDLLQNPWMVIHPPTLFVGFSAMVVPFAFAVAALWKKQYTQWVRPALPWTLFAVMILGVGIAMGGYWAYVTLSFGGYWAWDPVENSSLVPWIIGVAAFHTMLVQKKSGSSHKAALSLSILSYIFVIYSTFLTRSGILGDISVHSFVDLGLYNQLLIWILAIGGLGFGLLAYRYKELPAPDREPRTLSREFMIFSGAMLLCATAAVIILGTSAPIFGRLFRDAPSAVPIEFYNKWTLPLSLGFVFLAGLGQLFWWNKMSVENINRVLLKPIAFSVVGTVLVLWLTPFIQKTVILQVGGASEPATAAASFLGGFEMFWAQYGMAIQLLLLVFVGFFALFGNGMVLWRIGRGNPRMAGGAITHVGFAIMILGIVFSSGLGSPLPQLNSFQTASDAQNEARENFVLAQGETRRVNGYEVTYSHREQNERGRGQYILTMTDPQGRDFTLRPVAYQGAGDQWFLHPDVKAFVEKDIFVAVTPREATGVDDLNELQLARGDSTILGNNEYALVFEGFDLNMDPEEMAEAPEVAVGANLRMTNLKTDETRALKPVYIVLKDGTQRFVEYGVSDWGLRVAFTGMNVDSGKISLRFEGIKVAPDDWVVVQAYEKPFISLLWIGIIMLTGGFCVSIVRRTKDIQFAHQRDDV